MALLIFKWVLFAIGTAMYIFFTFLYKGKNDGGNEGLGKIVPWLVNLGINTLVYVLLLTAWLVVFNLK